MNDSETHSRLTAHRLAGRARVDRLRAHFHANIRFTNRDADPSTRLSAAQMLGPVLLLVVAAAWLVGLSAGFQTAVTILTITGFGLAFAGLFSPALGLLGVGLLATLDAATRNFILTGGLLRWNTLNYWLLVVVALNFAFILRLNDPHSRLLQLFIALLAVEILISQAKMSGVQDVLNITAAFGLLVYLARGAPVKGGLYWMSILSGLTAALGGFVYYMQFEQLPYVNPNSWAFFPLTGIFAVCLGFPSSKERRFGNFILLALAAVNFLWVFLSASRGSILVGVLCLLFLFLWTRRLTWKVAFLGLAWLVLGYFSLQFAEQQSYAFRRIEKLFNPQYTLEERTSGRSDIAQAGLQIFLQNPLGVGTGNFREAVTSAGLAPNEVAAHSGWIKVLAENGLPGILLLLAYILSFMIVGIRRRDRDQFMLGLLVTASFAVALLSKEFQGKGLWFFAAGAAVLLHPEAMAANLQRRARAAFDRSLTRLHSLRRHGPD